jgi:spermidine synthase
MKKLTLPTILLGISMFFTGASCFVVQNILSITASSILGNTFVQYGVTISLMLGAMGIGGTLQRYISSDNILAKYLFLEMLLILLTGFALIGLYAAYALMPEHFLLIQYLWIILVGLFIGFEIPIISRINETYQPNIKDNLASIMTMDYVGSMIGGLLWTFVFLGEIELGLGAFLTAGLNLIVSFAVYFYFMYKQTGKLFDKVFAAVIITSVLLVIGFYNSKAWEVDLQQKLYDEKIVFNKITKYQILTMTHDSDINDYRLYINGNLQFSSIDENIYHEHLVHPILSSSKKRDYVLILGGGDGFALREVLKYPDVKYVNLVDLDPEMIKISSTGIIAELNHNSFKDARVETDSPEMLKKGLKNIYIDDSDTSKPKIKLARVEIFNIDAFNFIKDTDKKYDAVIIDFPDPSHVEVNKLYTKEFFIHLQGLLNLGANIVVQSTSPYHAKEAYLCIDRTMKSVGFKTLLYHHNVPSFGDWGWIIGYTDSSLLKNIDTIQQYQVKTTYLEPSLMRSSMFFGKSILDTKEVAVNTILNPVLLKYYTKESWKVE